MDKCSKECERGCAVHTNKISYKQFES